MDYDESCLMPLSPGVVHNFPKAVGVKNLLCFVCEGNYILCHN